MPSPAISIWVVAAKSMSESATDNDLAPERWTAPAIDGSDQPGFMTAEGLQELQKQAWDEAYAEGLEAGRAAGEKDVASIVEQLESVMTALAKPLAEVEDEVEQQIVDLAIQLLRQLFRREIHVEPEHVIGVVREALELLPVSSRNVRVHLHPDDARLVSERLSQTEGECAWVVVEDPLLNRGGCRVTTDNSQIDASNESRLQAVIASVRGEERKDS